MSTKVELITKVIEVKLFKPKISNLLGNATSIHILSTPFYAEVLGDSFCIFKKYTLHCVYRYV
jgi:hypothetical protein